MKKELGVSEEEPGRGDPDPWVVIGLARICALWIGRNEEEFRRSTPKMLRDVMQLMCDEVQGVPRERIDCAKLLGFSQPEVRRLRKIIPRFGEGKTKTTLTKLLARLETVAPAEWQDDTVGQCSPVYDPSPAEQTGGDFVPLSPEPYR